MIQFLAELGLWKPPLIITHVIPFLLIPAIMLIFHKNREYYIPKINSYILVQIGYIFLLISMVFEVYSHAVIQKWDYESTYNFANGAMFVLMTLAFSFVSLGLKKGKWEDILMVGAIIFTPIGYALHLTPSKFIGSTVGVIFMTWRGYQVLQDKKVFFFPLFSFAVNMVFLMLLAQTMHPIYHILHDVLGTLLGFAIFGYLFHHNAQHKKSADDLPNSVVIT